MKRLVYIFNWLYLFSLSLWIGGMFLIGILAEAMVRIKLREHPLLASKVMDGLMGVFNVHIVYTCITLILVAELIKFLVRKYSSVGLLQPIKSKLKYSREIILALMAVLAIYMGSILTPQMHEVDLLNKSNPENNLQIKFDKYHKRFELIYAINMILGLSLLYIHGKEIVRFREDKTTK